MEIYNDEDAALDQALLKAHLETPPSPSDMDQGVVEVQSVQDDRVLLREYVKNYKPATTINELEGQMFQAKQNGVNAVEASEALMAHYLGPKKPTNPNWKAKYFMYKDIRVYLEDSFQTVQASEQVSMEDRVFGKK